MPHRPHTSQDTAKRFAYGIYLTAGIFALVGSLVEAIPLPSDVVVLVAVGTTPALFLLGVVALVLTVIVRNERALIFLALLTIAVYICRMIGGTFDQSETGVLATPYRLSLGVYAATTLVLSTRWYLMAFLCRRRNKDRATVATRALPATEDATLQGTTNWRNKTSHVAYVCFLGVGLISVVGCILIANPPSDEGGVVALGFTLAFVVFPLAFLLTLLATVLSVVARRALLLLLTFLTWLNLALPFILTEAYPQVAEWGISVALAAYGALTILLSIRWFLYGSWRSG